MNDEPKLLDELDLGASAPRSDTCEPVQGTEVLRLQGPAPRMFSVEYGRDLTEADIIALAQPRGVKPRQLSRIHASHHSLARCLAIGMKANQAALVTGYSQSRISILQNDEAFKALVEEYRMEAKSTVADVTERLMGLTLDGLELLHERMLDAPESLSVPMLLDIIKAGADRTGHGPGQEVHLKMDRDFIDRPPRETHEEWMERRAKELGSEDSMGSTAGATDRGHNGRLVS